MSCNSFLVWVTSLPPGSSADFSRSFSVSFHFLSVSFDGYFTRDIKIKVTELSCAAIFGTQLNRPVRFFVIFIYFYFIWFLFYFLHFVPRIFNLFPTFCYYIVIPFTGFFTASFRDRTFTSFRTFFFLGASVATTKGFLFASWILIFFLSYWLNYSCCHSSVVIVLFNKFVIMSQFLYFASCTAMLGFSSVLLVLIPKLSEYCILRFRFYMFFIPSMGSSSNSNESHCTFYYHLIASRKPSRDPVLFFT